jgi:hypothetical protein
VRITAWTDTGNANPLFIGERKEFHELDELMQRFNVKLAAIDLQPEERKSREFAARHAGRVVLIRWAADTQAETMKYDEDERLLRVKRTWAFDQTVNAFTGQLRLLPTILPPTYVPQVTAPYRVVEDTMAGGKLARYMSGRADHYFLAECYDQVARLFKPVTEVADLSGPAPPGLGRRRAT